MCVQARVNHMHAVFILCAHWKSVCGCVHISSCWTFFCPRCGSPVHELCAHKLYTVCVQAQEDKGVFGAGA